MGSKKGSTNSVKQKVARLSLAQLTEIAQVKLPDMSALTLDAAKRIIAGTARSMGVEVERSL